MQNGGIICPQTVVFTCTTKGSSVLTWRSGEYIGDQIVISSEFHNEGYTRTSTSTPSTVATLTRNYVDNDVRVLESTLHIIASPTFRSSSVTCVSADSSETSITFQVLG